MCRGRKISGVYKYDGEVIRGVEWPSGCRSCEHEIMIEDCGMTGEAREFYDVRVMDDDRFRRGLQADKVQDALGDPVECSRRRALPYHCDTCRWSIDLV